MAGLSGFLAFFSALQMQCGIMRRHLRAVRSAIMCSLAGTSAMLARSILTTAAVTDLVVLDVSDRDARIDLPKERPVLRKLVETYQAPPSPPRSLLDRSFDVWGDHGRVSILSMSLETVGDTPLRS